MPLLTDFITPKRIDMKKASEAVGNEIAKLRLNHYIRDVENYYLRSRLDIYNYDRKRAFQAEEEAYIELWRKYHYIPNQINNPLPKEAYDLPFDKHRTLRRTFYSPTIDLTKAIYNGGGARESYTYLIEYSSYPIVQLGILKGLADKLGFVILPISYVKLDDIFEKLEKLNSKYGIEIKKAFNDFLNTVNSINNVSSVNEEIYLLGPASYFDIMSEITAEEVKPIYFSSELGHLEVTLRYIIPSLKVMYNMMMAQEKRISDLALSMQTDLKVIEETFKNELNQLDRSFSDAIRKLNYKVEQFKQDIPKEYPFPERSFSELSYLETGMPTPNWVFDSSLRKYLSENGKHIAFDKIRGVWKICSGADPIIFAIDKSVDVSNSFFDKMLCRIGLCFGPELPLDFFTSRGLNPVKTNGFKSINKAFKTD